MIEIDEKFIADYTDKLELSVLQHIAVDKQNKTKQWTLKKAHDYVERIVSTLFGTPQHTGIINYLAVEQPQLNLSLTDALSKAEKLIEQGWSVKKENERYFLLDSNFRKVKDVSGSADVLPAPVVSDFGPENCWMLLDETNARKLAKEAGSQGIDTTLLSSPEFAYQFVVNKLGVESPLFPFVQMYKGLGEILRKLHYFESDSLTSFEELRAEQFRVTPKLNPGEKPKTYMSYGSKGYTILPVGDNYLGGKPADSVFVPEAYWKRDLLKPLGVEVEAPIQIGEMKFTFALGFEDTKNYTNVQDLGEVARLLYAIQSQNKARNYPLFDKIIGQLAAIYFLENFIVGNSNFTLANISLDTVKPSATLRYSSQGRNYQPKEIKYALENANTGTPSISIVDFLTLSPPITEQEAVDNLGLIMQYLPEEFKSAIHGASSTDSYIQKNLDTVKEYL